MTTHNPSKVLFIGLVWPEPTSSAAGYRILQLLKGFQNRGYEVHFASAAQKSERSFEFANDVCTHDIILNDDSFDQLIKEIQPDVVVYDRFMIEEQYGWRVRLNCPEAVTVLDTEDLHFVRKAREISFKKNLPLDLNTEDAKRELASILRCDLTLIISREEMTILEEFHIPNHKLVYIPFIEKTISDKDFDSLPNFSERQDFCFIGNFIHEPNYQTVVQLKKVVWPLIKKQLPEAKLFVYGAYPSQKVWDLSNKKEDFYVIGSVDRVEDALHKHRVLLAPIPFGAGIKGKFVDGAKCKIPNVTTSVGAESMQDTIWNGYVSDGVEELVLKAVELYQNEIIWNDKVKNGQLLINQWYADEKYSNAFFDELFIISNDVLSHRRRYFIGEILFQQQFQASKFLSLWIMEKNK
jgi:O-antigen biosynthesis protein